MTVLCSTGMFVAGVSATLLDNTVPGTLQERGMLTWQKHHATQTTTTTTSGSCVTEGSTYDFPIGMSVIRKATWLRMVPISPTFTGFFGKKTSAPEYDKGLERLRIDDGDLKNTNV